MSKHPYTLPAAFVQTARERAHNGDIEGAIAVMETALAFDLPSNHRRDAREIMDLLLIKYFKRQS